MNWTLDRNRPICPQLCEQICARIVSGKFAPQQRIMSVREVALAAGVNPNTVQHAFEQLERQGVLYSVRGAGWYVSANIDAAQTMHRDMVHEALWKFFDTMHALGISVEDTKKLIKEWEL